MESSSDAIRLSPTRYRQAARLRGAAQRIAAPLLLGALFLSPLLTTFIPAGVVVGAAFVGLIAFIAFVGLAMFPLAVELPARDVAPPVRGRWRTLNSPATKVPSHGTNGYGQTYAFDLIHDPVGVPADARGFDPPDELPTFDQEVIAVADGTVVSAADGMRDHRCRATGVALALVYVEGFIRELFGARFMLGNRVVLDLGDGVYAAYAHLRRGSVPVAPGDRVRAGDVIGRAGNSGNSTEPHLHFQLMDHPKPLYAAGVPFALPSLARPGRPSGIPANDEHLDTAEALPRERRTLVAADAR